MLFHNIDKNTVAIFATMFIMFSQEELVKTPWGKGIFWIVVGSISIYLIYVLSHNRKSKLQ